MMPARGRAGAGYTQQQNTMGVRPLRSLRGLKPDRKKIIDQPRS